MIVHRRALRTPHRRATDTLSSVITLSSSLRTATVAGAAVLALGLSGCSLNSPVQTDVDYPAADGVGLSLGDVQLRNVAVVATTKDGPGTLIGQVVNQGDQPTALQLSVGEGGSPVSVEVPAGGATSISSDATKTSVPAVPGGPGDWVTVTIAGAPSGVGQLTVPVLSPKSYLEDYAPTS